MSTSTFSGASAGSIPKLSLSCSQLIHGVSPVHSMVFLFAGIWSSISNEIHVVSDAVDNFKDVLLGSVVSCIFFVEAISRRMSFSLRV